MAENTENNIQRGKADHCALCGKKLGLAQKMMANAYHSMLADGVPCTACDLQVRRLLEHKKLWIDAAAFKQALGKTYDWRKESEIPTEWARKLFALRDSRCEEILRESGGGEGVFAAVESFQVVPSPPIFILRAKKVRCKSVLRGLPIRGTFQKGDRVTVLRDGVPTRAEILDAIPRGTGKFSKDTFYDQLQSNIHDHSLSECEEGWLILDLEDAELLPTGGFAAKA